MKRSIAIVALASLCATGSVSVVHADTSDRRVREEFTQTYDVGREARLSLDNLNGDARITGWDRGEIEVRLVKVASSQARLDDIDVRIHHDGGRLRIEVDYGDSDDWGRNTFSGVDFEIQVPRGADLEAIELVNGDLEITGVSGDVDASSVNGEVTCGKLAGEVDLSTVNGDVSLTADPGHGAIHLSSVNGTVKLMLPRNTNARLSASTVHGDIRGVGSEFEADTQRFVGSSLKSVLGKGGAVIDLETVNGDIRIRQAGTTGDDSE